jgi:small subunit ribosomal protein S5
VDVNDTIDQFEEEVISIRRVTKVVKGGKNMRFSAAVIVGNKAGRVGMGKGKAREVPLAIKKAVADAKKNLVSIPLVNDTVPYLKIGSYGASRVVIRPASPGTGVIAGGSVRIIMELAGVKNILTKILQSKNPLTVARATMAGLQKMMHPQQIARKRNKQENELWQ